MKRLDKLKMFLGLKFDEVVKVSETGQIKAIIKTKEEKLKELATSYYKSEGKRKSLESKIEGCSKTLDDIKVAAKKCKENNDEVNLNKLFVSKKNIEKELEMLKETLKLNEKMSEDLYVRKTKMETYINNLKHKLEQLKIKEEYTSQANEFVNVMKDSVQDESIESHEEVINIDFNAAELRIEDFDNDLSVDDIIEKYSVDEEYDKFISEL
ncbi:MAG: hypothetical protein ACRDDY_07845 [Clostridium sp.]|uniref:hypothetical protein n=1 Tax=Clostridium sp. TaxID=1506 RepID=UPI003EE6C205